MNEYESEVCQYAENRLCESEKLEQLTPRSERSIAKDLIEQEAYDLQRDYGVSDEERDKVMVEGVKMKIEETGLINKISGCIHCPQCKTIFTVEEGRDPVNPNIISCPNCGYFIYEEAD